MNSQNEIMSSIPSYIVNLPERQERLQHVLRQFEGRPEFTVNVIKAIKHDRGATGLWLTVMGIVKDARENKNDIILICEDDHLFTGAYTKEALWNAIAAGKALDADILIGGASFISSSFNVCNNLYWIDSFTGTQFVVLYAHTFDRLLSYEFSSSDYFDYAMSRIFQKKLLIYPFISVQQDFGYSDATESFKNKEMGHIAKLFGYAESNMQNATFLKKEAESKSAIIGTLTSMEHEQVSIATYLLCNCHSLQAPGMNAFSNLTEFDIRETVCEEMSDEQKWLHLQHFAQSAIQDDEDLIIVCNEKHVFPQTYSYQSLMNAIKTAFILEAELLLGDAGFYTSITPLLPGICWVPGAEDLNFIIIYKSLLHKIAHTPFHTSFDRTLFSLSAKSAITYPFLSEHPQREPVYTNIDRVISQYNAMGAFLSYP